MSKRSTVNGDLILCLSFGNVNEDFDSWTAISMEGQFGSFLHDSSPDHLPWHWSTSWQFGASWRSATHFNHLTSC